MYSLLKRERPRAGRVTGTRAPIVHVRRRFPARALRKKEYVHVWGELSARAPPSCTCRGCSPRVRSAKKSTCECGASCRHARPHRARAERALHTRARYHLSKKVNFLQYPLKMRGKKFAKANFIK